MMGYAVSFAIIGYLLIIFPVLAGLAVSPDKKREIDRLYAYGSMLALGLFSVIYAVAFYFEVSLSQLSRAYLAGVVAVSIFSLAVIVRKKKTAVFFSKRIGITYMLLVAGTIVMVVFRKDTSSDRVLETTLRCIGEDSLGDVFVSYYGVLSNLSDIHATLIGKWIIPFVLVMVTTAFLREVLHDGICLWIPLFFLCCFENLPGYMLLWEAPWTPQAWMYYGALPLVVVLFLTDEFGLLQQMSLVAVMIIGTLGALQGYNRTVIVGLLAVAVILTVQYLFGQFEITQKMKRNKYWIVPATVFMVLSFWGNGCIFIKSDYAFPDNRYKMDEQIMEIRIMTEPMEEVKMIAEPEVLAQMNDGDLKVKPFIAAMDEMGNSAEISRWEGILTDLEINDYASEKLIQHGLQCGCNIAVSKTGEESDRDMFEQFGFRLIGNTKDYEVYQYIGENSN